MFKCCLHNFDNCGVKLIQLLLLLLPRRCRLVVTSNTPKWKLILNLLKNILLRGKLHNKEIIMNENFCSEFQVSVTNICHVNGSDILWTSFFDLVFLRFPFILLWQPFHQTSYYVCHYPSSQLRHCLIIRTFKVKPKLSNFIGEILYNTYWLY